MVAAERKHSVEGAQSAIKVEFKVTFGIDEEELELFLQTKNEEISE